ncbi:peptide/nickel transport system substrate-binding protein [Primorskyibacter sedentarius]|uniref:Peptide/nickel transport system substrate-binding protein n=1 Tax=Primorskyibacter sedentarius TaxID=745311 RepID=A0A4R3J769_9RHOB|nr:ABC transporter substrate-binding protein [Primorskyibacter sedentarius]TCS60733.1 peptide/nickel transport system substrate-binding protein [Primorskyibacter sedentarius]
MTFSLLLRSSALASVVVLGAQAASAETFRWASTTDPQTMDPHAVNAAPVLSFLNNIYEGLVRRNQNMQIEPSLATSWEPLEAENGWRFHLREGVTFQDGAEFNAEDVLFSYQRASDEAADVRSWFAPVSEVRVVDDYTVDFVTTAPNPLFPDSIANFMILDKGWAEANDAALPARDAENFATMNVNGTGAFSLSSRDPGVETRLVPNPTWWDEAQHNVTEAVFTPIGNSATGLAALLSGEIDFIQPIPLQDVAQVESRDGFKVLEGEETRVIMFGFGHEHEKLLYSTDVTDANPFQDPKVRLAAAHAIDIDAIDRVIMRGKIEAASQLVPAGISGYSEANADRPAYDPERAKELLAEAGYPDGFSFGLKCTNDRYINDEALCRAAASMFAAVDLKAELTTGPVRDYWTQLREDDFDMYLLGWSPGTFDAEHPIRFLLHSQDDEKKLGSWNFGNYSNARVDELLPLIQEEIDPAARQALIDELVGITQDEVAYIPLYTQPLIWAAKENIDLTQRADNFFMLRWVTIN